VGGGMNPLDTEWSSEQTAVFQRLREWSVGFGELNQHLAAWMGLPSSDANALGLIIWGDQEGRPFSPAVLSQHIGMTSGATTTLLNRLEVAGHIIRSREHDDRRRVTLRPQPRTRERAAAFFTVAGVEIAELVLATPDADLRQVRAFLEPLIRATHDANRRLSEQTLDREKL
jgi:MarR family transcriptional regulator, organic hydroperoxide resistance regulator